MILPLPLTPFEEYMVVDDRPSYPMNFFLRLRFSGRADHAALEASVTASLARHPLLGAIAQPRKGKRWQWIAAKDPPPPVHRILGRDCEEFSAKPIDVRQQPGFRLNIIERDESTECLAQFHHACSDGLGGLFFMEDVLTTYARSFGTLSGDSQPEPFDPEDLLGRGRFGLTPWQMLKALPGQSVGLLGVRQFLARRPIPLAPVSLAMRPELPLLYPVAVERQLTTWESASLIAAARRQKVSLNDLLVRDWFLAMGEWRCRHFGKTCPEWLRLAVPVSLRGDSQRPPTTANQVSMVFLDRRPFDFDAPARLLDGIHREMQRIKRYRLGLTFVLSLAAVRRLPGGLASMTRDDQCSASSVLTNLGAVFRKTSLPTRDGCLVAGDLVLTDVGALAPLRPGTSAALATLTYAGRLMFVLQHDPRCLDGRQANDLLDTFLACLRVSMGSDGPAPNPALTGKCR